MKKYFPYYWGGVLVALPLFYRPSEFVHAERYSRNMIFLGLCFLSFILFGFQELNKKIRIPVIAVFSYFSISTLINQYNIVSGNVAIQLVFINTSLILVLQFLSNFDFKRDKEILLNSFSIAAILQSVWFLLNRLGVDPYEYIFNGLGYEVKKMVIQKNPHEITFGDVYSGYKQAVVGSLSQHTLSGVFMAVGLPSLFRRKWLWFIPLVLFGIYLSSSAMVIASSMAGTLTYFFSKAIKTKFISILLLFFSSIGVIFSDKILGSIHFFDSQKRQVIWENALTLLDGFNDWVFGRGVGFFADNFQKVFPIKPYFVHAHNDYVDLLISFGVIGLVLFFCLFNLVLNKGKNVIFISMLTAFLVNALANFPFQISVLALMPMILFSILIKEGESWH